MDVAPLWVREGMDPKQSPLETTVTSSALLFMSWATSLGSGMNTRDLTETDTSSSFGRTSFPIRFVKIQEVLQRKAAPETHD